MISKMRCIFSVSSSNGFTIHYMDTIGLKLEHTKVIYQCCTDFTVHLFTCVVKIELFINYVIQIIQFITCVVRII